MQEAAAAQPAGERGGGAAEQEVPAESPDHQKEDRGQIFHHFKFHLSVQGLIEREYMKRSEQDRKLYIYLA